MRRFELFMKWVVQRLAVLVFTVSVPAFELTAQERVVPSFLPLQVAVDIALDGSTRLGSQSAQLQATKSRRANAWWSLGPNMNASAFSSRQTRKDFDVIVDVDSILDANNDLVGLDITRGDVTEKSGFKQAQIQSDIVLFDGGANWARVAAAGSDVHAGELNLKYTKTTVIEAVIEAYYGLLRAKLLLAVSVEARNVSNEQLERTQALYDLGSAARSDVLKSQVQLGQTRLELVQARNRQRQARDELIFAMNLVSAGPFEIDTTIVDVPTADIDFDGAKHYALKNRFDLLSLRESEKAENHRVWEARGALWPSVNFRYTFSRSDQESRFILGSAVQQSRSWSISTNWNIFDRWLTYSNISNAKAQRRVAEYNRRQAELDAVRELRTHVNSLREAQERLALARENVERSEEDLRLAQEKFRVGAGTILDTITAESDLSSTKGEVVQATTDILVARAKLARASGRPFEEF